MRLGRRLAAPIRFSGGEISKLINGIVRALEASEFEERLARLEEKANELATLGTPECGSATQTSHLVG
jgi:hypothetical protein